MPFAYSICWLKERSTHMIDDELTNRDIYMYNRGRLDEYVRSRPDITVAERLHLLEWIRKGNDIRSNPFGAYDETNHCSYDYLDAERMASANQK